MRFDIELADLSAPAFADLVDRHVAHCDGTAAPENCHRLEVADLDAPDITVWQARELGGAGRLLGMIALRPFTMVNGEIKSMHTIAEARGSGVARALLVALEAQAQAAGLTALYLETGTHPDFDAARQFYAACGYAICPPFGSYVATDENIFMSKMLGATTPHQEASP